MSLEIVRVARIALLDGEIVSHSSACHMANGFADTSLFAGMQPHAK